MLPSRSRSRKELEAESKHERLMEALILLICLLAALIVVGFAVMPQLVDFFFAK